MLTSTSIASSSFFKALSIRSLWVFWLCALASLSALLSRHVPAEKFERIQWALELAAHWQFAYASIGFLCFILLVLLRRSLWALLPAFLVSSSFLSQSRSLDNSTGQISPASVLAVGTANLNYATLDFNPLVSWLLSNNSPDLIFLQEFTESAGQALGIPEIVKRYPYRVFAQQPDQFGLAILSRYPLTDVVKVEPTDHRETLRLRAVLTLSETTNVHISAVHPMPPLNPSYAQIRDQMLIQESQLLAKSGGLALIAGDFNTTPWVQGMFGVHSNFRRAGASIASWPNFLGVSSLLPLDHILATCDWLLLDSERGPNLGSDHRPVLVKLEMQPNRKCSGSETP